MIHSSFLSVFDPFSLRMRSLTLHIHNVLTHSTSPRYVTHLCGHTPAHTDTPFLWLGRPVSGCPPAWLPVCLVWAWAPALGTPAWMPSPPYLCSDNLHWVALLDDPQLWVWPPCGAAMLGGHTLFGLSPDTLHWATVSLFFGEQMPALCCLTSILNSKIWKKLNDVHYILVVHTNKKWSFLSVF